MSKKSKHPEFPGYRTIQRLGEGATSNVYLVEDKNENKYAVKQLCIREETLQKHESGEQIVKPLIRFKEECEQLIRIKSHENIVRIVESVIDRKKHGVMYPYFVMEYIHGGTLQKQIENKAISFEKSLEAVLQITKAVGYLHNQGIYHRDIHADNIVFSKKEDKYVLLDFGLLKDIGRDLGITTKNNYIGYLTRIPIEFRNAEHDKVSHEEKCRAFDIAGAGDLLYNLLTIGKSDKEKGEEFRLQQYNERVDDNLYEICMKALQKDTEERYTTIQEFEYELEEYIAGLEKDTFEIDEDDERYDSIMISEKEYYIDLTEKRHGGEADVYRAYDTNRNEYVIKLYREGQREAVAGRIMDILDKINRVAGKHIVNVYASDIIKKPSPKVFRNKLGIVMDNFQDGSLDKIYQELDEKSIIDVIEQTARGVDALHKQGIIHRDIKPGNILVQKNKDNIECFVSDFGLAKMKDGPDHTTYGNVKGTKNYMAFEYTEHKIYNEQTDIFALGVTFYELLTKGKLPYQLGYTGLLEYKEVDYSQELTKKYKHVLEQMLAEDSTERYISVEELIEDVESIKRRNNMRDMAKLLISNWKDSHNLMESVGASMEKGIGVEFVKKMENFSKNIKEIESKYESFFKTIEQLSSNFKLEINPQLFPNYSLKKESEKEKMLEDLKGLLGNFNEENLEATVKEYGSKQVYDFLNEAISHMSKKSNNIDTIEMSEEDVLGLAPLQSSSMEVKELEKSEIIKYDENYKMKRILHVKGNVTSLRFEKDELLIFNSYILNKMYHRCSCYNLKSKELNYEVKAGAIMVGYSNGAFIGCEPSEEGKIFFKKNSQDDTVYFIDGINNKGRFVYNGERSFHGFIGKGDTIIYLTRDGLNYYSMSEGKVVDVWRNGLKTYLEDYGNLNSLHLFDNGNSRTGILSINEREGVTIFDDKDTHREQSIFSCIPDLEEILFKKGNVNYSKKENMAYIGANDEMYSFNLNSLRPGAIKDEKKKYIQHGEYVTVGKVINRFNKDVCIEIEYCNKPVSRNMQYNKQYSILLGGEKAYFIDQKYSKNHQLRNAIMSDDQKYIALTFAKEDSETVFIYTL